MLTVYGSSCSTCLKAPLESGGKLYSDSLKLDIATAPAEIGLQQVKQVAGFLGEGGEMHAHLPSA